jgi:predicted component of type VI protein secretion system
MTGRRYGIARAFAVLCAVAVVTALSGCAPSEPAIDSAVSSALQATVADVTQAAADGNPEAALAALDVLQAQLSEDTASGAISADRSAQIQASIDLVRADFIAALPEPSPTPTPDEKEDKGKDNGKDGDKGNGKDKDEED